MRIGRRAWRLLASGVALGLGLGCPVDPVGPEPSPQPRAAAAPAPSEPVSAAGPESGPAASPELEGYLDGALLEASYDIPRLASFVAALPRSSPSESPFVTLVGGLVDVFAGRDSARDLEALGLRADGRVRVSARALDGRAAAVRKRLGERVRDGGAEPAQLEALISEARTLGLHMRASVPKTGGDRLVRTLETLIQTPQLGGESVARDWAPICAGLEGVASCSGWPRLLVWSRESDAQTLQIDAIYLFHAGAREAELARAVARADGWAARSADQGAPLREVADMELEIHAQGVLSLLGAEALADVAEAYAAPASAEAPPPEAQAPEARPDDAPYSIYLDHERALRELLPPQRVFDGLALALDYELSEAREGTPHLRIVMRWLPAAGEHIELAPLFAPVQVRPGMPGLTGECARALACVRLGGLAGVLRFGELAQGPFADLTGAARVLRQAGERGQIMILLSAWPQLLGTAAQLAGPGGGMVAQAQSALLGDTDGLGFMLTELEEGEGEQDTESKEHWVGYLRLGSQALAAILPAAGLVGASPKRIELPGVDLKVERGSYEGTSVYFVDEPRTETAWILAADADARAGVLLTSAREISTELEPLWFMHLASLGPVAAHEELAHSEDPPIRAWLDTHELELRGGLTRTGPELEIVLRSRE